MKYQEPSFSLPTSNGKISQEEWDRIFDSIEITPKRRDVPEFLRPLLINIPGPALRTTRKSK